MAFTPSPELHELHEYADSSYVVCCSGTTVGGWTGCFLNLPEVPERIVGTSGTLKNKCGYC